MIFLSKLSPPLAWLLGATLTFVHSNSTHAAENQEVAITQCLAQHMETQTYSKCIGLIAEPCAAVAADSDHALQRLASTSQCYWKEYQVWEQMLTLSENSWHEVDSSPLVGNIERAAKSMKTFRQAKCSIFEDMQQFGVNGQVLAAQCQMEETAEWSFSSAISSIEKPPDWAASSSGYIRSRI